MNAIKTLALAFLMGISVCTIQAQDMAKKSPEERAEKQSIHLKVELGLSDEQTQKVKQFSLERIQKVQAIRQEEGNKKEKRSEIKMVLDTFDAEMKTILTADQWATFQEKREEMEEPETKAEKKANHLQEELKLSEQQMPKVEAALLEKIVNMDALRNAEEKQKGKRKEINDAFDAKMKTILTAEQYALFSERKEDKKEMKNKNKDR